MNQWEALVEKTRKFSASNLWKNGVLHSRFLWLGVLGVTLIVVGGLFDSYHTEVKQPVANARPESPGIVTTATRSYEEVLEGKLSDVLSQVNGAGAVTVSITLDNSGMDEYAKNIVKESKTVQEKDTSGGLRTTTEMKESDQLVLAKDGGNEKTVIVREYKPAVKGVLVVATGAYNSTIKANLTEAVEAALGIPAYKITVLPQRK